MLLTYAQKLGRKITRQRERLKISQAEAARRAGITPNRWHESESGKAEPTAERLYLIADALETTADNLRP